MHCERPFGQIYLICLILIPLDQPSLNLFIQFQVLALVNGCVSSVDKRAFCGLDNLVGLMISCQDELQDLQPLKKTLRILEIGKLQFASIPSKYFHGFLKLRSLSLTRGVLESIPPINALARTIDTLNLEHNKITHLLGDWLNSIYEKLRGLRIEGNRIFVISSQIWKAIPNISGIIIFDNEITHIEDPELEFLPKPTYINLRGNPLDCTSRLAWIISSSWLHVSSALCNTPSCRKGMQLLSMSEYIACQFLENHSIVSM